MMRVAVVLSLFIVAHAGHAPYLGGDIQELMEATKMAAPGLSQKPAVNKPVTEKQRRDSSNYNAKFADIAKAYAEGYKAAIKAVQARAFIAKRRLLGIKPNSNVPGLAYRNPYLEKVAKSIIPGPNLLQSNAGKMPEARFTKSTIPIPDNVHTQISSTNWGSVTSTNNEKAGIVTKSTIPAAPEEVPKEKKSDIPFSGTFNPPVPFSDVKDPESTVEKSIIPSAPFVESSHQISERSTPSHKDFTREDHPAFVKKPVKLWTEEERMKIAKLNARARHRNVYFDGAGGDPFRGGGVLSYQNAISKKHRRRRSADNEYEYNDNEQNHGYVHRTEHFDENHHPERERRSTYNDDIYYEPAYESPSYDTHFHVRQRRSHMPYLGQNLDAMGVIRAVPRSWTNPQKKSVQPRRQQENRMLPEQPQAYFQPMPMDPARFNQFMAPAYRGTIPQPVQMPTMPAMMSPPLAMNYAAMFSNPQPPPNFESFRSVIPGYPAFMPGPLGYLPGPMPAGITSENSPSIETKPDDRNVIVKKDIIPHPPVEAYT